MTADAAAASARSGPRGFYHQVVDPGSLVRFGADIEPGNPSDWPGYPAEISRARQTAGSWQAVTTGVATAGSLPCVIVGFEFAFLGGSLGRAEGARIAAAFGVAIDRRLPVVSVTASGGARMQEGPTALMQMPVIAAAIAAARQAGVPHIAVVADPTTGGVWSSLAAAADVIIGVDGARISFSGSRTRPAGAAADSGQFLATGKWRAGFLDVIAAPWTVGSVVAAAVGLLSPLSRGDSGEPAPLPAVPPAVGGAGAADDAQHGAGEDLRDGEGEDSRDVQGASGDHGAGRRGRAGDPKGRANLAAWEHLLRARDRSQSQGLPRADAWLAGYFDQIFEIRGDRCGGVDTGLRCGFGAHAGRTIGFVAQGGQRTRPAGFRTATRLLGLACRLGLPVLTLIDTPGAAADPADEAAGTGTAIADLLVAVAASTVPITSVIIGEGVSGGAMSLVSPANLWIAPDGYLAVTAPELAAAILKRPAGDVPGLTGLLRLTPADLLSRGIVRGVLPGAGSGAAQLPCSR